MARLSYAIRCVSFLTALGRNGNGKEDNSEDEGLDREVVKRVFGWFALTLKHVDGQFESSLERDGPSTEDLIATKALLLEALAVCAIECHKCSDDGSVIKKTLSRAAKSAGAFLLSHPRSVWTTKGAAAIVRALARYAIPGIRIRIRPLKRWCRI